MFPCRAGDKRPAVDRWEQRACADPGRVARYWPSRANVGIACGPSRLVVIDLDTHGELPGDWQAMRGLRDGSDVFAQLLAWAGQPWPQTYWVATPSGGWHLYFTAPAGPEIRNSAGKIGPLVDVRAAGGYVVGAGSVVGGHAYEFVNDSAPAPLPGWLRELLTSSSTRPPERVLERPATRSGSRLGGLVRTVRASQPGQQTDTLVWAAFRLREEIGRGHAAPGDAEQLVQAALQAGMRPETYVRYQVRHVLGDTR